MLRCQLVVREISALRDERKRPELNITLTQIFSILCGKIDVIPSSRVVYRERKVAAHLPYTDAAH